MRQLLLSVMALLLAIGLQAQEAQKREMRTVWVATVSNIDWPQTRGTGANVIAKQKKQLTDLLDGFEAANMNAICLQVRDMSDAFYRSSYEPWSSYITGTRGQDPGWDPLEFAVQECHKRGLECHAWVNPYRFSNNYGNDWNTPQDVALKNSGLLMQVGKYVVFNPALEGSRQRVVDVCREMIENYDIDGIIFDDYFYPGGGTPTDATAPDYQLWQQSGTSLSLADWRRANVNLMVRNVYDMVQTTRPGVKFAIGPAGVAGTRSTSAAQHGVDPCPTGSDWQYNTIYSDPLAWLEEGTIDYISPQLYWKTNHATNPFGPLTQWWSYVANHFGRHHYASHNIYFMAETNTQADWDEILQQIRYSRQYNLDNAPGVNFYSAKYISGPTCSGFGDYLSRTLFTHKAMPPALTWKTRFDLGAPQNLAIVGDVLSWDDPGTRPIKYGVYAIPNSVPADEVWSEQFGGIKSDYLVKVSYSNSMELPEQYRTDHWYAVTQVDGWGNEYEPAYVNAPSGQADTVTLLSPADGATVEWEQRFDWSDAADATYRVQVSSDADFSGIALDIKGLTASEAVIDLGALSAQTTYYWRVITQQRGRLSTPSQAWTLVTGEREVGNFEPGYVIKRDVSAYEPIGRLRLDNRWVRSVKDDYANIVFDGDGLMNRGFTVWNGRVLVIGRSAGASDADVYILHYDARTGELLKKVMVDPVVQCSYYPGNDIFQDDNGHVLISNLVLNIATAPINLYHVDPDTGHATLMGTMTTGETTGRRVDHCNVRGDIMARSYHVYAALSNGTEVVKWQVAGAGSANVLGTQVMKAQSFSPTGAEYFGLAPRVYPGLEETVWVTGGSTHLTRYDLATGKVQDSFDANPSIRPEGTEANGAAFFELQGRRYMLYPYSDYRSATGFRFMLAQSEGGEKLADYRATWIFPAQGLGSVNSATWDAPCCVTDGDRPNQKNLYVYVPGNGLAAYTLTAGVLGDVTGDGTVDVADVNAVINIMLGINTNIDLITAGDVTGDGTVGIEDVNTIVNIMLGKC
ncbi:MAG: family 10 glycosylhydrolase [Muribaculaceae bacterium]|nr:family 10 glycosylhydrolase [Muribaculaceae bacterium]